MFEIPLKEKYRTSLKGKWRSNHNDGRRYHRKKTGVQPVLPGIRTMVVLPNGKTRMEWR